MLAAPDRRMVAFALAALAASGPSLRAQAGAPPSDTVTRGYRPPGLWLVQPAEGVGLPNDQPVVVFRFAPGEPNDPLDLTTFRVAVDTVDRSGAFTVTPTDAWGPLSDARDGKEPLPLMPGAHVLHARICSIRGACAAIARTVTLLPPAAGDSIARAGETLTRRQRLIDLLLEAVRRILTP